MEFLKNKREQAIFLVASLALVAVGFFMNTFAIHRHDIAIPLITIATSIAILSVIHLFLPDKFFKAWKTITFLYVCIALIFLVLISIDEDKSKPMGHGVFLYNEKIMSTALAHIYYALSFSIILYYFIAHKLARLWKKKPWQIFSVSGTLIIIAWVLIATGLYVTELWKFFANEIDYVIVTLVFIFLSPVLYLYNLFLYGV